MIVRTVLRSKTSTLVCTISPDQTIADAARELHLHRIGALVVMDDNGGLAGILSERDIARGLALYGDGLGILPVRELMTRAVLFCTPDDSLQSLMQTMTNCRVRHLPVMENGTLVGIMTIGDVVKNCLEEAAMEVHEMRGYVMAGR